MSINFALVLALFNMSSMRAGRVVLTLYALQLGAQPRTGRTARRDFFGVSRAAFMARR